MKHNRMHLYLLGAVAIAAALVIAKVPLAGIVPFALLAGCGLMMFFMMKGMGAMGGKEGRRGDDETPDAATHVDSTPDPETAGRRSS